MGRRRGVMSDALKYELAKELGVDHLVEGDYWGAVTSKDCGGLVAKAIEYAERALASQNRS